MFEKMPDLTANTHQIQFYSAFRESEAAICGREWCEKKENECQRSHWHANWVVQGNVIL